MTKGSGLSPGKGTNRITQNLNIHGAKDTAIRVRQPKEEEEYLQPCVNLT